LKANTRMRLLTFEEERRLIVQAQAGDTHAADQMVQRNMGLVHKAVRKIRTCGARMDTEDMQQWGVIGLLQAVSKFKLPKGTRFSTYATYWIYHTIRQACDDEGFTIGRPGWIMDALAKILKAKEQIEASLSPGQEATYAQIAEATGLPEETVELALTMPSNPRSLDEVCFSDDSEVCLGEMIEDEFRHESQTELEIWLAPLMGRLSPIEHQVLRARHWDERTLEEVAEKIGASIEGTNVIQSRALATLRRAAMNQLMPDIRRYGADEVVADFFR
jgi:DNA-directed RNA polymerase sigma subunit (sigma70/sigma32)